MVGMIALAAALLIACAVLGMKLRRTRREQRRLTEQVEAYLTAGGAPLEVSTEEDDLARLQNAISELQVLSQLSEARRIEENRRASNLMADISHQLKTPLASLKLFCELDGSTHMTQELSQIERMERLIYALLRLERLSADGYSFQFSDRDLRAVVEEAWRALEDSYPDRHVAISGDARVRCDAGWMGETVGNLLKNACEHTPEGGEIRVHIEKSDSAAFLTVEDDGGVEDGELSRLFERFYRAKGEDTAGSGLGLSIAREIVRHHHGTIHAENTLKGLRIVISIPVLNLATAQLLP